MARKKLVVGNWKMNNTITESENLINEILKLTADVNHVSIGVCPPFPFLLQCNDFIKNRSNIFISAQNCAAFPKGAYTGEVSASMLSSIGVSYCLVGHSERRSLFLENNVTIHQKINQLLINGITPIWCCGEQLIDRNNNNFFEIIEAQLVQELFELSAVEIKNIIIAYEPVWAIGTGLTAMPNQAQEIHEFIRKKLALKYGNEIAQSISILYGGSCNAGNAAELFALADVDGGLIGGASLQSDSFVKIINSLNGLS